MKKHKIMYVLLMAVLLLGMLALAGCGGDKEAGGEAEGEGGLQKITASGVTLEVPEGWYAVTEEDSWAGAEQLRIFKADKATVESTEDYTELTRIMVLPYLQENNPDYAGPKDAPVDFNTLKTGFTERWAKITGTTPAAETKVGEIPFMYTETSTNGIASHIMAGVVEGYLVEIKVVGEDLVGSEEAQKILDSLQFDLANNLKEE